MSKGETAGKLIEDDYPFDNGACLDRISIITQYCGSNYLHCLVKGRRVSN